MPLPIVPMVHTRAVSLLSQRMRWLTRLQHRMTDLANIAAFSLYPLDSLSTSIRVALKSTTANDTSTTASADSSKCLTIEQWTALGSGGFVWGGSRRLADYLASHYVPTITANSTSNHSTTTTTNTISPWSGLNVIELGAGTGALGLSIAALGANVTLTDQAAFVFPKTDHQTDDVVEQLKVSLKARSLLDLMRVNVQHNLHHFVQQATATTTLTKQEDVQVREMLWGNNPTMLAALPHKTYDLIIASDVLLFQEAQQDLLSTLRHLSSPQTVIFIEHTDRSGDRYGDIYPDDLQHFLELLESDTQVQWHPTIVVDHGRHITLRIDRQDGNGEEKEEQ